MADSGIRPTREIAPIVAIIGEAAALALLEAYAGTRIQVPVRATAQSALARAIGLDAARALVRAAGGEKLKVPLAKRWRIMHLRRAGMSYAAIARAVGCNEATVHATLADGGMTRQLSLDFTAAGPRAGSA